MKENMFFGLFLSTGILLLPLHNDYPLAPERYKPEGSFCEKLCGTFNDKKDYILDIKNLRFYLEKGLVLKKKSCCTIQTEKMVKRVYWFKYEPKNKSQKWFWEGLF